MRDYMDYVKRFLKAWGKKVKRGDCMNFKALLRLFAMPKFSSKTSLLAAGCVKVQILSVTNLSSRPPKFALFLASGEEILFFGILSA